MKLGDVENDQIYPMMMESPQLRWGFIRKVYAIISMQLLLTAAVAAAVVFVRPIPIFFVRTTPGMIAYVGIVIFTFIVLCPLYAYHRSHPLNFILLTLFTIGIAFSVGISCAFTKGEIILEAAALTSGVVVGLTLYTFWAVKQGHDFSFLDPFLFASLLVLFLFGLIQILFPLGKLSVMIYSALSALLFCGYIVYDTDNLIKRFSYDDYIWAAVTLYLDIVNLFLALLNLLRALD
ncbi:BI1-like protein isoform X1 [Momordica charantia]|uniref:BI1-like protein isoform X1 n=1 Tax=Momordica charantia TaxID=3673 RepID=A0A6J1CAA6_MOMCH|nr:BI1-like protein isoform X1 [Momordica charantia]